MNTLEMYKRLSREDKNNLTAYCIYDSIYTVSKNNDCELSDDEVERLKELSHYVYLKDEYYNFSSARISDFLTECYTDHKIPLETMEDASWSDILEAVDNEDYEFCMEEKMER